MRLIVALIGDLFGSRHYVWCTRLTLDECRRRLLERRAPWFALSRRTDRPIAGRVSARGFDITRFIPYRNSGQTHAIGAFQEGAGVTRIDVRMGVHPVIQIGMALYFALMMPLAILAAVGLGPFWLLIPVVGGLLVSALARWLARSEESFLVQFLKDSLEAVDCGDDTLTTGRSLNG